MTMRFLILASLALFTAEWRATAHAQWPSPPPPAAPETSQQAPEDSASQPQGGGNAQGAKQVEPQEQQPASSPKPQTTASTAATDTSQMPQQAPGGGTQSAGASPAGPSAASASVDLQGLPTISDELKDEPDRPQLPWMASFSWTQGYTAAGLAQGSTQTFNPTYAWAFLLTAGYNFGKATALIVNQYAVLELTDSDTTNTRQELTLYDTTADVSHKLRYEMNPRQELALVGALGLGFPASKTSQAASLILTTRARIGAAYSWKRVLRGLEVGPSFSYWRRFNSSNTLAAESRFPCDRTGSASQDCFALGSASTSRDVFLLGLDGNLSLTDKWVAGVSLTFFWVLARPLATSEEMTLTGPVPVSDTSITHSRNTRWLLLSLGYKITDWFSATARVTNIFSERGPAGQLRGPLNPIDTVLGLDLAISFDQLYLSSQGHGATQR